MAKDTRNLKNRNGFWYFKKSVKRGKHTKRYEFSLDTTNITLARKMRDQYNQEIREHGYIIFEEERSIPPFGDVVEDWYEAKKMKVRTSTLRTYKEIVNNYLLKAPFVEKSITKIEFDEVEKWSNWLHHKEGKNLGARTVGKILNLTSNVFKYARRRKYTTHNPVKDVERPEISNDLPDVFTPAEVEAIINSAPLSYKNYITFRFYTGMRPSECNALKYKDLNLKERSVRIRRGIVRGVVGKTKNRYSNRVVKLNDTAYQALSECVRGRKVIAPEDYVWLNRYGNPIENINFNKSVWKNTLKRAGVRYRPSQLCRHTHITHARMAGERAMVVAKRVGHRDTTMIQKVYEGFIPSTDDLKLGQFGDKPQNEESVVEFNPLKSLGIQNG